VLLDEAGIVRTTSSLLRSIGRATWRFVKLVPEPAV
jgi:hypothetical protein